MKISVIGCGYLGAVHAASMADLGHQVVGIDLDDTKIAALNTGRAPFFEPGLDPLLSSVLSSGRLRFSSDLDDAVGSRVHFVAVGTPQASDSGAADLTQIDGAFAALQSRLRAGDVVVGKSTVPVGTAQRLAAIVESAGARLVWNPEFLREGLAIQDTLSPDRLVYGIGIDDSGSAAVLDEVYAASISRGVPRIVTDFATAELVKVAANAFLATKISFINAMADVAGAVGADVTRLADAIGFDERIGRRFLNAGLGFGGGCLPKDIRAFVARGDQLGLQDSLQFLREVDSINQRARDRAVSLVIEACGGPIEGRRVAVLGLAFKPNSDDVRDSPALDVATRLRALGALVRATDPQAIEPSRRQRPELEYVATAADAARDADVVVVLTEWSDFVHLDPDDLGGVVAERSIVDARNCLDPQRWRSAGWRYRGVGRP